MRQHGSLLLCSCALSAALVAVNSHTARALVGVDPQMLVRDLEPANLLGQEKTGKSSTADKKGNTSASKASPSRASSSPNSPQLPVSNSIAIQESVSDLTSLPAIDTSLLPYPYPNISPALLVKSSAAVPAVAVRESSAPAFAASSEGWKVAGLTWYWWLTILALAVGAGRWGLRLLGGLPARTR